ncbi:class I SAM-dependent methyltransferase [Eggerthella guodeyinii]|uniref:Methyltransferase domain-containing protein n=1 Tax=Eggerthella guodeyinii TaxID=2690837 RepID=A0A6N7RR79_9ACTN|nr:class I SAM-dependent methyltransferase [Eggerthella guodeyinii]MRX83726.1 methyltransferase domain-containing protein [Eggerthella guodeyinii]
MGYVEANKEAWEEAFEHRLPGWGEDVAERLQREELPFLNPDLALKLRSLDLAGKDVAQFCCNNGRELLSLMQLGPARGVGFDIAENILDQARDSVRRAGVERCTFVAGDVLAVPPAYDGAFDLVLFTVGAITWIEDLDALFARVATCLKPGGAMVVHDFHPVMNMLPLPGEPGFDAEPPSRLAYSYFRSEPWIENEGMGYLSERYESKTLTSFSHTMSAIVNATCRAGLTVDALDEFDYDVGLSDAYDGRGLPLSFLLTARKRGE